MHFVTSFLSLTVAGNSILLFFGSMISIEVYQVILGFLNTFEQCRSCYVLQKHFIRERKLYY